MILRLRLIIAAFFLFAFISSAHADITTTSQDLEEFSFKKGLKTSGGLSFSNDFYAGSDSLVSRDPYAFYLNGNLNFNLWGISMPFSFSFSNTQKSFTQPFNRFKLDPRYKWVHLLIGTNVMSLGKYTLSDHDFNGVGVELTPGNWEISGMWGRLNKAIEFDPEKENYNTVCYKRIGYAAKLGYHSSTGNYEVTFFHGEDKKSSLLDAIPDECLLTPRRNTAVSAAVTQKFLTYFNIHAEYAFSVYNSNLLNDENEEVVTSTFIDKLFGRKQSDKMTDAFNASIGYQGPVAGVSLQYERISPYYSSLGGYYFNEDEQNITVAPNLKFLDGRLSLAGQFGLQYNNLNNDRATDTRHIIYSANASYNTGKVWMITGNMSNYKTYTKVKPTSYPYYANDLDSLNFYQVSRSFMLMNAFNFGDDKRTESLSLSTAYQNARSMSENVNNVSSDFFNANLSFSQQFVPSSWGWTAYVTGNFGNAASIATTYFGPGASANKSFFENVLALSLSVAYNINRVENRESGSLMTANLGLVYNVKTKSQKVGKHSFSLNSGYTQFMGAMVTGDNRFQSLTNLTYRVSF